MNLFNIILGIHILNGALALLIAPLAMLTTKGGLWHRRWGKIYFWAMAGVALTAAVMCWLRSGLFLFLIAIFSFYLALTGYRVLRRKRSEDKPQWLDWCAAMTMVVAGGSLIALGIIGNDPNTKWVRATFGIISLYLGIIDVIRFIKPPRSKQLWLLDHMTRFLGAYVATITAFSVVNFQFLPYIIRWLWPTAVGVVGIVAWRAQYQKKFKQESIRNVP